eukprot:gene10637-biopygen13862
MYGASVQPQCNPASRSAERGARTGGCWARWQLGTAGRPRARLPPQHGPQHDPEHTAAALLLRLLAGVDAPRALVAVGFKRERVCCVSRRS